MKPLQAKAAAPNQPSFFVYLNGKYPALSSHLVSTCIFHAAEFKRLGKGGKEIWLQASYNPVFDDDGNPIRIVKFATDVTASKLQIAEFGGKMRAINRAQAVIEFELDGTVITAVAWKKPSHERWLFYERLK